MSETTLDNLMDEIRKSIKEIAKQVKEAKEWRLECPEDQKEDRGEVLVNLMLSYRHLEDASMRLGKVKQALNEGVSVYDPNVVGSPDEAGEAK